MNQLFNRIMIDTAIAKTQLDVSHPTAKAAIDSLEKIMAATDSIKTDEGIIAFMVGFMKGGEYGTSKVTNLIKDHIL